jgi:hypothetical protein
VASGGTCTGVDDKVAEVLHTLHSILRRRCKPAIKNGSIPSEVAKRPSVPVTCGISHYHMRKEVGNTC